VPWRPDFFVPLQPYDRRNDDRLDPKGERIRVRLNRERGELVDFVVQYETPTPRAARSHAAVLRSDGSHVPHYDQFDRFGNEQRIWLPEHLSFEETVQRALDDIEDEWTMLRRIFYRGLP
jgi:gamma-glutamylcyclotransferase (GGCT)/AIG2-like uncharacterized protein YtfP